MSKCPECHAYFTGDQCGCQKLSPSKRAYYADGRTFQGWVSSVAYHLSVYAAKHGY